MMMEVTVTLDFACCACAGALSVTVKCAGKGLTAGARSVAAVTIACPDCGSVNKVYFEPCGTVRDVTPVRGARPLPEPSLN